MRRRIKTLIVVLALVAAASGYIYTRFAAELRTELARVTGRSDLVRTRDGPLEYAIAGRGPPVLMIHGTGGGFDQGLAFSEGLLPHGYQVIAPSRFGYLRSGAPADPSPARQADAFVDLLNHLGIDQVIVAGGSAGALSAVQFALRHPGRCAALVLIVPAANVRGADPVEMSASEMFWVRRLTTSNLLFWAALKTSRARMIETLLATDPALVAHASPREQQRAHRILIEIMPVALRSRGMLSDAHFAGRPARVDFSRVRVPTLVISAEDDRFGTAATARDIAAAVPNARLLLFPDGGHIWVGHDDALWQEVAGFAAVNRGARNPMRHSRRSGVVR